ncbi:aldehyde dehydrogenase family protein [Aquidulcibacter sp.]|jgi:aldehyde dehydrogenase (NAD+)|uniref:aldehyde dehydrogenase family protein n=2 Tax=Aquidulcibacter sp. TaxID=2052990 RepID=UPI0028AB5FD3|nr:aldehyde dehydrogenase family protein [Aquidulcibacter sp.]
MIERKQFYIDGAWVDPVTPRDHHVINPATEEAIAVISLGGEADAVKAILAARAAFPSFSETSHDERIALLEKIIALYSAKLPEIAHAISQEMGAPMWLATAAQAPAGLGQLMGALNALKEFTWEHSRGNTRIRYEAIGVCSLITPWNWPMNQIGCKVGPALAAGCTMVLKPSELAPLDAMILADIIHEAGVPKGVFNLVNGDGPGVGSVLSTHEEVDFVSFTGSTRAGIEIAKSAAPTVKRIAQELGGKSPNIVLEDADIQKAVSSGVMQVMTNSGQSCNAPTRMFVPRAKLGEATAVAKATAESVVVADPAGDKRFAMGPLANGRQFEKVQSLIEIGMKEATLVAGGMGRPEGFNKGYFVRPTVFVSDTNDTTIAREEIFGPVLTMIPYDSEADAVAMANDTVYGLSGYVQSENLDHARSVAKQIRAGMIHINGASTDTVAPFGGYKQSGNGREWGDFGLEEFLEVKAVMGYGAVAAE